MRWAYARVRRARAPPLHPRLRAPIPPVEGSGRKLPCHVSVVSEGGLGWAAERRQHVAAEAAAGELPPLLLLLATSHVAAGAAVAATI